MAIRAKMQLYSVIGNSYGPSLQANFSCVYDPNSEEDKSFQKATPSGTAQFTIDNPAVFPQLVIGKQYYFDIFQVGD
ncbi:MAG: hypothetical protein ACREHG_06890 [Candidatus Saccharimonadales bacterium]